MKEQDFCENRNGQETLDNFVWVYGDNLTCVLNIKKAYLKGICNAIKVIDVDFINAIKRASIKNDAVKIQFLPEMKLKKIFKEFDRHGADLDMLDACFNRLRKQKTDTDTDNEDYFNFVN